jgi:flagellar biogenesis protein FliO
MSSGALPGRLPKGAIHELWQSVARSMVRLWKPLRIQMRRPVRTLRLQETLALGEKRFLAIVSCGDERFLIGSAQGAVSLLATLPKAEADFENVLRRSQDIQVAK